MGSQVFHSPGFAPPSFTPRGAGPTKSKREQNADRQREFRDRNPGYYGRLHAKRKAMAKAYGEQRRAAELLAAQESAALAVQETATVAVQESVTIDARETVTVCQTPVAQELVKQTIDAAKPVLQETATVESERMLPESDRKLPASEAMLLLMLVASLTRLQKHRADLQEWPMYRAA